MSFRFEGLGFRASEHFVLKFVALWIEVCVEEKGRDKDKKRKIEEQRKRKNRKR